MGMVTPTAQDSCEQSAGPREKELAPVPAGWMGDPATSAFTFAGFLPG